MQQTKTEIKENVSDLIESMDENHSLNIFKSKNRVKPNEPFAIVFPRSIRMTLEDNITITDLKVLLTVMEFVSYGNVINLTQQTIANEANLTKQQVSRSFKTLENKGYFYTSKDSLFLNPNFVCKGDLSKMKKSDAYKVVRESQEATLQEAISDPEELSKKLNEYMKF